MLPKPIAEPIITQDGVTHGLSLRHKIILGFVMLFLIMLSGLGIILYKVMDVGYIGIGVVEKRQPALLAAMNLLDDIDLATTFINSYLLTGHEEHKTGYLKINEKIKKDFKKIRVMSIGEQATMNTEMVLEAEELFRFFADFAKQLMYLRENEIENYPGIAMAAERLNPLNLEYMGLINRFITEAYEMDGIKIKRKQRLQILLSEVRYSWIQMINGVRIFFSTRAERDLLNSENYRELNGELHKKLEAMDVDLGFESMYQLSDIRNQYLAALSDVIEIFRSDAWRSDAYLMKTEVRPIVESLREVLETLTNAQLTASKQDSDLLSNSLQQIQVYTFVIMSLCVIIGFIVSVGVAKSIEPITKLTTMITQVSLDDPKNIEKSYLSRRDEVGGLARAFEAMLMRLSGSYQEIQKAKQELEQRVTQRTQQLETQTLVLERSNRELDQFAYVTSHDLKAPLRAIANLSEWIEEDISEYLDEDTRKQMNLLRGRVHRMEALINGILEYSRIGRVAVDLEKVNVGEMLAEIVDLISPPKGFQIEIGPNMPTFDAVRVRLSQVFSNLLSNSLKYVDRPDGKVDILVSDIGEFYEFTVADNGPGVPAQFHEKIFQIFQTLQSRDKKESTGIGLTIVKKIVEEQGGTIRIKPLVDDGAVFVFTWPKKPNTGR